MSVLYFIMGKSASGKDTIFQELKKNHSLGLKTIIPYTTRPKREHEKHGREYYFLSKEQFLSLQSEQKIIESRTYQTIHGDWTYFTADDGQIIMDGIERYILIGTLETYQKVKEYYQQKLLNKKEKIEEWLQKHMKPIYIEVENGMRLERALQREQMQDIPRYAELCRRFLADEEDFSEEKLRQAGIVKRFQNEDFNLCIKEIETYIGSQKIL